MKKLIIILLILKLLPYQALGQQFFRIKADFSIKEKLANGSSSLIMGTVYYDKGLKKIVYDITFPRKEKWIIFGSLIYNISGNKVVGKQPSVIPVEQSIFNIALNGQLADYGLKNSTFKISNVEKDGNMIISTWLPETKNQKTFGKIIMSHIDKKLYGIIFHSPTNEILSKQIFKNYVNTQGCEFPTQISQTLFAQGGKNLQLTTYKNIVINATNQSEMYNYSIPY